MQNVTEYGAAGDGETVDTEAIQDAVDAAHDAGGGRVVVPAGEYLLDGPVAMRSRVHLVGEGMGASRIVTTDDSGWAAIEGFPAGGDDQFAGHDDPLVDLSVRDLTIDASGLGDPGDYTPDDKCIHFKHVHRCQLLRVHAYGSGATGIGTDLMVDSLVAGCIAENCGWNFPAARDGLNLGSNGIGIGTGLQADTESVVVANCQARGNGNNGIMFESQATGDGPEEYHAGHMVIHGCTSVGNRVGYRTSADRRVRIANCSAQANDEEGVVVDEKGDMPFEDSRPPFPAREHRIDGCHVTDNGSHGVHVLEAGTDAAIDVANCHVGENDGAGVRVATGERIRGISVADCEVYDNAGPGVEFADGGADLRVTDCDVAGNGRDGSAWLRFGGDVDRATVSGNHLVARDDDRDGPAVELAGEHEGVAIVNNRFRGGGIAAAGDPATVGHNTGLDR